MKIGNLNQLKAETIRFLVILLIAATVAIVLSSCGYDDGIIGQRAYDIYGTITDSITKAPLDSAWTAWLDTTVERRSYSNSVGNYKQGVPAGPDREIYVGKPGYRTKTIYLGSVGRDRHGVNVALAPVP